MTKGEEYLFHAKKIKMERYFSINASEKRYYIPTRNTIVGEKKTTLGGRGKSLPMGSRGKKKGGFFNPSRREFLTYTWPTIGEGGGELKRREAKKEKYLSITQVPVGKEGGGGPC